MIGISINKFRDAKAFLQNKIDKIMSKIRIDPDTQVTLNALDSFDPFARPGQSSVPLKQPEIPPSNRDVSRFDEPVSTPIEETPAAVPVRQVQIKQSTKAQQPEKPKKAKALAEIDILPEPKAEPAPANPIIESRSAEGAPSYRCEFVGRDIMLGCCFYKGPHNGLTMQACMAMALDFGKDKLRFEMCLGDAKIGHSRNRMAAKFLESDAKYLLMIDDDIVPCIGRPNWMTYWVPPSRNKPEVALQRHVLHRLIGTGKSLVGGAYFGRQENGLLMCSDTSLAPRVQNSEDAVVAVDWVATGCLLIHRKVFSAIREKFGDSLKVKTPDYDYDYFREFDAERGEDVSFCLRAKEAGEQAHIDLGLPVYHVGYKIYG
jgi:hypothetical protein